MTESVSNTVENALPAAPAQAPILDNTPPSAAEPAAQPGKTGQRTAREVHPVLEQLAKWYPAHFGEVFLPLKRGIFQDLLAAHGEQLNKAELKVALAIHTRSTRYLNAVASGSPRYDLQGAVVEPMAPEHVFHALVEVFKRKRPKDGEDLKAKLRRRMGITFMVSGLSREDFLALIQVRDADTQALLDEALAEVAEQDAKAEAVQRAFTSSGVAEVEKFADMYGMNPFFVRKQLARAKQLQAARAA